MSELIQPKYLWHWDLHRHLARERLSFWLLQLGPTYRPRPAIEQITTVLNDAGVRSYVLWELCGEFDILMRVWLPEGLDADVLQSKLKDGIHDPLRPSVVTPITTDRPLFHWAWPEHVEPEVAKADPMFRELLLATLTATRPRRACVEHCVAHGYVAKLKVNKSLKYFIAVNESSRTPDEMDRTRFETEVLEIVANDVKFDNVALYRGSGQAKYLITGRCRPHHFYEVSQDLALAISDQCFERRTGGRTNTMWSARFKPLARREELHLAEDMLPSAETAPKQDRPQYLSSRSLVAKAREVIRTAAENEMWEMKAAAFTDLKHPSDDRPLKSKAQMVERTCKAVVAMLNAYGGCVIVGAAEASRLPLDHARLLVPEAIGAGEGVCIGVEHEFKRQGRDRYLTDIGQALERSIEPVGGAPFVHFDIHTVLGRKLLLIVVEEPPVDTPFWLKRGNRSTYYTRVGARSQPLSGSSFEQYRTTLAARRARLYRTQM